MDMDKEREQPQSTVRLCIIIDSGGGGVMRDDRIGDESFCFVRDPLGSG